jgi:hypothetical protein
MMKRFSLRYSLLTFRLDQLWFPAAFWTLFLILSLILPEKAQTLARSYLGGVVSLIGGVMSAYAVLDDPALELRFATPIRSHHTLLERLGIILAVQAACALLYQLACLAMGVNLSILGNWLAVQLAWLVPTLALMALGSAGSLLAAQTMTGAFLVSLVWIVEVIAREWMASNNWKYILIFLGALYPEHPDRLANQATLLGLSLLFFIASWAFLRRQERYI